MEDSLEDPVPEKPGGEETALELRQLLAAEAEEMARAREHTLPLDVQAYRNQRFADGSILVRLRRRYARIFSEESEHDVLDDLVQETVAYALLRRDFPAPSEPMFPWIYRPGEAKRKQAIRRRERARAREVPLDESIDAYASVPPPDGALPGDLENKAILVEEAVANDTGKQRTLEQIAMNVVGGESLEQVAAKTGTSRNALKQRISRLSREMRMLAGAAAAAALCVAIGTLVESKSRLLPWNSGNDLAHTHDPKAPPNAPQAGHDDRIDKLLDDAEDALRKGDLARCTEDTAAARFQGGGDRARLEAVTEKCLRALDNVPVSPTSSAPSPSPRPSASGSRPRAPKPAPTGPDPSLRSLLPVH